MSDVIVKRASYDDYERLRALVFEMMDAMGGDAVREKKRVLIKPNLLGPSTPDMAMVTHPLVVRAAAEYVISKGVRPTISDSPAMGTFEKVMKECGMTDALRGLDVESVPFSDSVAVTVGEPFERIEIAEAALNADFVVNLPKLKTHSQMLLTLGVKNLFGCIVGLRKPQWHLRAGVDREMFARLLVLVCTAVRPSITLLDGILAMEGQGPGKSGVARQVGVLAGSCDVFALDAAICGMLGLPPEVLPTCRIAQKAGLFPEDVRVEGDHVFIEDFKLPEITSLVFGPARLHGLMRKHLVQRPVVLAGMCRSCGDCRRYCPAQAISQVRGKVVFDYEKCIRCYCCIEVCPHAALRAEEPLLGRLFNRIIHGGKGACAH